MYVASSLASSLCLIRMWSGPGTCPVLGDLKRTTSLPVLSCPQNVWSPGDWSGGYQGGKGGWRVRSGVGGKRWKGGERGNEGKQTEMSLHTYHTHIHTLQSAQLSSRKPAGPPPFLPRFRCLGARTPRSSPPLVNHGRSHAASISPSFGTHQITRRHCRTAQAISIPIPQQTRED